MSDNDTGYVSINTAVNLVEMPPLTDVVHVYGLPFFGFTLEYDESEPKVTITAAVGNGMDVELALEALRHTTDSLERYVRDGERLDSEFQVDPL